MATDQLSPTVLLVVVVDPDGWLHQVPRRLFTYWCEEKCIDRPDNPMKVLQERHLMDHVQLWL